MNFRELTSLYKSLGYTLERKRGYCGNGYYYKRYTGLDWQYIGDTLNEVQELYYTLR